MHSTHNFSFTWYFLLRTELRIQLIQEIDIFRWIFFINKPKERFFHIGYFSPMFNKGAPRKSRLTKITLTSNILHLVLVARKNRLNNCWPMRRIKPYSLVINKSGNELLVTLFKIFSLSFKYRLRSYSDKFSCCRTLAQPAASLITTALLTMSCKADGLKPCIKTDPNGCCHFISNF